MLLCGAATALGWGQNRANFPWWNSPITAEIITQAQARQIHQIVRAHRDRLFDARNTQQKAEAELEDLLNDPEVNADTVRPVIERIAAARANTSRVFLEMSVQVRGVLTLEQWRTLTKRWEEMQRKKPADTQTPPE